jgi:hypothetical protein
VSLQASNTAIAVREMGFQERTMPSRPSRLGTRRRRPPRAVSALPEAGALRRAAGAPSSLDTDKYLQTSERNSRMNLREWVNYSESESNLYARQMGLHAELLDAYHKLWQDYHHQGDFTQAVFWEQKWLRVYNCRKEWIGYYADCCKGITQPCAVPVGCNDRLCPLCAWDRAKDARRRIKGLFPRLTHPAFITLTVPNRSQIRKHNFTLMRQRVKQFCAQHKGLIAGGVYALETTRNRQDGTWHIHVHILCDLKTPLPTKEQKVTLAGEQVYAFTALKLRLEFDWLRLWTREHGSMCRGNAGKMAREGDTYTFERWVEGTRANKLKQWRNGRFEPIANISASEMQMRTLWNIRNRRVVDIRPVTDRDKAVHEVLKYITKGSDFTDDTVAVEAFIHATKGVRLLQTFGTWYGVKLDEKQDPNEPRDWEHLTCTCGVNLWRRMGLFERDKVEMDAQGRWWLKREFNYNSRGTIPRPTIRALDERQE